jgi:Fic family protein
MATDLLSKIQSELDARIAALRPAFEEYERLQAAADAPPAKKSRNGRKPAAQRAAAQAIIAALEHGSHSTSELVTVTAIPTATINLNLRHLCRDGVVKKVKRGAKSAYELSR